LGIGGNPFSISRVFVFAGDKKQPPCLCCDIFFRATRARACSSAINKQKGSQILFFSVGAKSEKLDAWRLPAYLFTCRAAPPGNWILGENLSAQNTPRVRKYWMSFRPLAPVTHKCWLSKLIVTICKS